MTDTAALIEEAHEWLASRRTSAIDTYNHGLISRLVAALQDTKDAANEDKTAEEGEDPALALAQRFHETYERLAPIFHYKTRPESAVEWKYVPAQNKALMVAVVREILPLTALQDTGAVTGKEGRWEYGTRGVNTGHVTAYGSEFTPEEVAADALRFGAQLVRRGLGDWEEVQ